MLGKEPQARRPAIFRENVGENLGRITAQQGGLASAATNWEEQRGRVGSGQGVGVRQECVGKGHQVKSRTRDVLTCWDLPWVVQSRNGVISHVHI